MCFSQDKEYEKCSELLQKTKKLSNEQEFLEMGVLKILTDSLPVGGAVRAGVLAVSTVMAVL